MSDTDRVRAWRDRLKQAGRVPITIWVTAATKARYDDLALTYHRSPSELAQQALDAYRPDASVSATVADTEPLRSLIRTELAQLAADVTATVTATVTDTLLAQLPTLVQAAAARGVSVTEADTETVTTPSDAAPPPHTVSVTDTATDTTPLRNRRRTPAPLAISPEAALASEAGPPPRRGGRPPSPERQQILTLLQAHPEGLSATEVKVYLQAQKSLSDTLQGMRKSGVLSTRDDGKTLRYRLASAHPHR
jgi:hypothetical protein